jgi:hypothetical protein|eukprot:COSAG01_NODE_4073_length_5381_cov_3.511170_10_plen_55_part_00
MLTNVRVVSTCARIELCAAAPLRHMLPACAVIDVTAAAAAAGPPAYLSSPARLR